MSKKINVGNILAGLNEVKAVTESLSVTPTHESIPARYIKLNPHNTAAENDTPESIAELAAGIKAAGLIHPLAVNKISDTEYRLISGEHRYKAITTHLGWETIPCTVYPNISLAAETVTLLIANLQTREYTVAQKLGFYKELDTALHQMKENGEYQGSISKGVAQLLGVSDRQIRKYKQITENMTEEEQKNITNINEAAAAAAQRPKVIAEETSGNQNSNDPPSIDNELEVIDAAIWNPRIGFALQHQLNRDETWRFYTCQLPTAKEAVAFLKPSCGYSGSSGWDYPDGKGGGITRRSGYMEVEYGRKRITVKYGEADTIIRELIRSGKWLQEKDIYFEAAQTLLNMQ
jgi:ParB/RepB/Spo0J family partition protein